MNNKTLVSEIALLMFMLAIIFIPACTFADIYKCVSDDGIVKFSDQPCGENSEKMVKTPSIDELIAQARPYKQPFADPDRITSDLIACSRKIADGILPDQHYHYNNTHEGDAGTRFTISLMYVPEGFKSSSPNKFRIYEVMMTYKKRIKDSGYELWLVSIAIKLGRSPISPKTMEEAKSLKKIGAGEWVVRHP